MLLSLLAVVAGSLAAFFIVCYVITIEDSHQRVAVLFTILASDVLASILSYVLFPHSVFLFVVIFALTKCITWVTLIDPEFIVHYQLEE